MYCKFSPFPRLKYVKSAKAATDVPTTVRIAKLLEDHVLTDMSGPGVHLAASSLAERFSVRVRSRYGLLVPYLDLGPGFLPQDRSTGTSHNSSYALTHMLIPLLPD